jgi:hypothetical protein
MEYTVEQLLNKAKLYNIGSLAGDGGNTYVLAEVALQLKSIAESLERISAQKTHECKTEHPYHKPLDFDMPSSVVTNPNTYPPTSVY